jgi:hypothetical protein
VCSSSSRPPLLELVSPSSRFRPPLLATGYVVHLQFVASFTTVERHLYRPCSRHLSTLAAVDRPLFRFSSRVFIVHRHALVAISSNTFGHSFAHRLLAVASSSVHVAASPTTAGAGFSAVNRFRPPLLATGLVVPPEIRRVAHRS